MPHEQGIVDCPTFQRLRKLKQLALANLVYPGANHTRFDHSLGAFHVASRMASVLGIDDANQRIIRLAALLHDVGHGPFSHVSEPILKKHSASRVELKPKQQVHELITAQIIREDQHLARLILEDDREQVIRLLGGSGSFKLFQEIVSGPMDADKQDYLLRDNYFCGVKYGLYDIDRLLNSLKVHEDAEDRYLALTMDGIHVLEQFVLAKYYMTTQVYRHRIRLITDKMIWRAIDLGIEVDKIEWLKSLYTYDSTPAFLEEYKSWNDDRFTTKILEERDTTYAYSIFRRLVERRLLKCIFDVSPKDFRDSNSVMRIFAEDEDEELHRKLETAIAARWDFDKNLVICNRITFKSAMHTESEVLVIQVGKEPSFFKEESILFSAVDQAIHEQRFQIYAPVLYSDERDKKHKKVEFATEILAMINGLVNQAAGVSEERP